MNKKVLPYLLPFRCLVFILIFIISSIFSNKNLNDISNIWSIVASAVNIVTILIQVMFI